MHLLKYDTILWMFDWRSGGAILPLLFSFNYNMALLGVIFPTYFWPL